MKMEKLKFLEVLGKKKTTRCWFCNRVSSSVISDKERGKCEIMSQSLSLSQTAQLTTKAFR